MPIFTTEPFGVSGALPRNRKLTKSKGYIPNSQLSSELIRKMTFTTKLCTFKTHRFWEGYIS